MFSHQLMLLHQSLTPELLRLNRNVVHLPTFLIPFLHELEPILMSSTLKYVGDRFCFIFWAIFASPSRLRAILPSLIQNLELRFTAVSTWIVFLNILYYTTNTLTTSTV